MFDYRVKAILVAFPYPDDISGWKAIRKVRSFSSVIDALEYVANNSPYEECEESEVFLHDWIIEITLQDVRLEIIEPALWKALKKPIWDHPDHLKKLYKLNEGD